MDFPANDVELVPEKIDDEKEGGPAFKCDLADTEIVHKIAQAFLPGLGTACVDNTTGDVFRSPASVAVDMRKEMVDYLTQRSETFVAESVILEGDSEIEVSNHPYDIISNFVDDFASSKRNLFSRVSRWLLSEKREDKIEDFVQEMEINGFWLLDGRGVIAETLLKNVDFKNAFHCNMKFNSAEELAEHVCHCSFRSLTCKNEGCNARFCASHLEKHDSACPFKIIPCEQKCLDNIMRREMDKHCITVCRMKLVNCPFYAVGCQSTIPHCMIEKHFSDTSHSHLLYILQRIHKEASEEDLKRRVEQVEMVASSNQLAEAQNVRSLTSKVKDLEASLGPLEVHIKNKNSEENVEISNLTNALDEAHIKNKDSQETMETSNLANASSEVQS
ncbi:TNF receptor-associated factor family protein DDB_G0290965 [Fagus crenata]